MAKKKQHSVLGVPFKSSLKINTEALGFCKRLFEIQSLLRGASETPRSQAEEWVFSRGRCTVMHTACVDFSDEPCGIKFCVKKKIGSITANTSYLLQIFPEMVFGWTPVEAWRFSEALWDL